MAEGTWGIGLVTEIGVKRGTSLVVQWLRLFASNAGSTYSIPSWVNEIPNAMQHRQKNSFFFNWGKTEGPSSLVYVEHNRQGTEKPGLQRAGLISGPSKRAGGSEEPDLGRSG